MPPLVYLSLQLGLRISAAASKSLTAWSLVKISSDFFLPPVTLLGAIPFKKGAKIKTLSIIALAEPGPSAKPCSTSCS